MSRFGRVLRNTFFLICMLVTIRLLGMLLTAAIGRKYLQEGLGQYGFLLAFSFVAGAVMDLGISARAVRTFARDRDSIPGVFVDSLIAKGCLALLTLIVCSVGLMFMRHDENVIYAGWLFLVGMVLFSFDDYLRAHFDSIQRMEFSAILEIGRQALTVVASLWALQRGYGLIALGAIFAAAAGVQLAAWWILYGIYFPHPRWRADFRRSRQIVRQAAPFGGIVLIGALFPRMDLITVNLLSGDVETGRLNAALVFTALLMYMVGAMQTATFPVFSVLKDAAVSERARIYEKAQKLFTCAAVAIAVGVLILAMPMIRLVFGTRFDSSAVLLRLLSFGLLLHFLAMCSDSALKGLDRESVCLRILMLVCSVNLVLDLALIPYLKAEGAVVGNVVSRLCWVVLSFRALKRMFPELPLTPDLTRILLAGAIMAVPVFVLRDFPVLLVVPLGAVVYGLALLATRAVTLAELRVAVSALWPRSSAASA